MAGLTPLDKIQYRVMTLADLPGVPIGCQGAMPGIRSRIRELGSTAVLAFDAGQHVAQLQFRRYDRLLRSPKGLWDPLYWGDFGDKAPDLPVRTLSLFCYHVGQLDDSERRDTSYQGRGIGLHLLDFLIGWAKEAGFDALVAKATPPVRSVASFMGGLPANLYVDRGFAVAASWIDPQLREVIQEKGLVPAGRDLDEAARVSCCVRQL
jgi:GNAT superfamily N-acetyltransferase